MDETMELGGRVNEFTVLLSQLGDVDTQLAAGIITRDEYTDLKARQLAYTSALRTLSTGEYVDEDMLAELLAEMRGVAAQPTQAEEIALHEAAIVELAELMGGE